MPAIDTRTLLALLNQDPLGLEGDVQESAVESRCVSSFDYSLEEQTLTCEFPGFDGTGGAGSWIYYDFPLEEFVQFAGSFSLGTYFNLYIRDKYRYTRIS